MKGIRAELVACTVFGVDGFSTAILVRGAMGVGETTFFFACKKRRTRGTLTDTIEAARATLTVVIPNL
jgi:hypothetical protein